MAITPRHFLDFIKHYINVFHEKRRDLEEEKLHLNIGLSKVSEFLMYFRNSLSDFLRQEIELSDGGE